MRLGVWCLGGDFNITRWVYERFPVGRSTRGMRQFNAFIDSANLMETPFKMANLWSREGDTAARSLLDRFFINSKWDDEFENSRVTHKVRFFSDHFPLLLETGAILWGPSPSRFCNSWLLIKECNKVIEEVIEISKRNAAARCSSNTEFNDYYIQDICLNWIAFI